MSSVYPIILKPQIRLNTFDSITNGETAAEEEHVINTAITAPEHPQEMLNWSCGEIILICRICSTNPRKSTEK